MSALESSALSGGIANFAAERLIRRTPDCLVPLSVDDVAYIEDCIRRVAAEFAITDAPTTPIQLMPARAVMRALLEMRLSLKPASQEQKALVGSLAGAILRLDTACAFYLTLHSSVP